MIRRAAIRALRLTGATGGAPREDHRACARPQASGRRRTLGPRRTAPCVATARRRFLARRAALQRFVRRSSFGRRAGRRRPRRPAAATWRPFEAARHSGPGNRSPPAARRWRAAGGDHFPDAAPARPAGGGGPSRRAPAPRSAPPRPLHPWPGPGSARPRPRTAPAGSAGGAKFSPAAAGDAFAARLARAGAPGAPSEAPRAPRGAPGPRRPRRPRPRPRGHPISRASQEREGCVRRARRRFCSGSALAPEPGVLAIARARAIHEWGRRWSATALQWRKCEHGGEPGLI